MRSIRIKITAITVAAILISVLSVLGAAFFTLQAENDRKTASEMNLINENLKQSLDSYFTGIEQSVEMAAHIACDTLDSAALVEGGVAGKYASENPRTPEQEEILDAYLTEHCARVQEAFSSVASRTHGVVTYYYCLSPDVSQNVHGFFYSKVGKTGFYEQEPLDARELDPEDIEHTTWYYTPIERGRPSWIGPYRAHFLGELWTVSYLVPIYKAGTFIGVLGMDILFSTLQEQIVPLKIYDTGFACLLDENGKILYHPTLEMGSSPELAGMSLEEDVLDESSSGNKLIRYTVGGEKRQLSFTTLNTGTKLLVTAPVKELTASWTFLSRMILLITAVIAAVFAVILLFVMGIITSPLQKLTTASSRLADGDYDVELKYSGQDEVGTLTNAFSRMRDHMKSYISELNRRVYTDDLTGLPNMRQFFLLAEKEKDRIISEGGQPAIMYFDLIGMKYYNRQYSFEEGNQLICDVADILAAQFGHDNCSRFGQDHFTAIAPEENLEQRLKDVFRACAGANGGKSLPIRVGIYPERLGKIGVDNACDRAKYACDQSRGSALSGFYFFDQPMLEEAETYSYIINNFDRAIREHWIRVYYQPIVRAANGQVCDEEALSRWIDPERGLISPAEFIPVLEESRLIYKLDLYVLDEILKKMRNQKKAGLYVVPQSLNLSRVDFDTCDIIGEITKRINRSGIPAEMITIELTESTVGSDFEFIKEQVTKLQSLGFQVWMDDFGSGYSSLDVLQNIHFDLIKFDMRFMERFAEGNESRIILTELMKMAISLGIETIAEGVETKDQVEFLKEVGCTKLQGYYFCKAISPEEIMERYQKGIQIGFENPQETDYYSASGRINLYDLAAVSNDSSEAFGNFFDTIPMAVIETAPQQFRILRCNKSFRDFARRYMPDIESSEPMDPSSLNHETEISFIRAVSKCKEEDDRIFIKENLPGGASIHAIARFLAVNPVTGIKACALAVLGVTDVIEPEADSTSIAR